MVDTSSRVIIEKLEIDASIGVFEWEKQIKQKLVFDLSLSCDFSSAAKSDEIDDAIDYVAVCEEIERVTLSRHFQLLECLADTISDSLFRLFKVDAIDLKIGKPGAVPKTRSVGVHINRIREHDRHD